jgi:hypothetical protein
MANHRRLMPCSERRTVDRRPQLLKRGVRSRPRSSAEPFGCSMRRRGVGDGAKAPGARLGKFAWGTRLRMQGRMTCRAVRGRAWLTSTAVDEGHGHQSCLRQPYGFGNRVALVAPCLNDHRDDVLVMLMRSHSGIPRHGPAIREQGRTMGRPPILVELDHRPADGGLPAFPRDR